MLMFDLLIIDFGSFSLCLVAASAVSELLTSPAVQKQLLAPLPHVANILVGTLVFIHGARTVHSFLSTVEPAYAVVWMKVREEIVRWWLRIYL